MIKTLGMQASLRNPDDRTPPREWKMTCHQWPLIAMIVYQQEEMMEKFKVLSDHSSQLVDLITFWYRVSKTGLSRCQLPATIGPR